MDGRKGAYEEAYRRSIGDPEGFWGEAAEAVSWYRRRDREKRRG
jgi:propionyl-CoA synthetase